MVRAWLGSLSVGKLGELPPPLHSSLLRLLPNLVDNLVNRVLANVLPDLVRTHPGSGGWKHRLSPDRGTTGRLHPCGHTGGPKGWWDPEGWGIFLGYGEDLEDHGQTD